MAEKKQDSSHSKTIGFRVDGSTELRIRALAAGENKGVSEWLRDLVQERVDAVDTVEAKYNRLTGEIQSLHRDLATGVEALLALVGSDEELTAEKAKRWVDRHLRRRV